MIKDNDLIPPLEEPTPAPVDIPILQAQINSIDLTKDEENSEGESNMITISVGDIEIKGALGLLDFKEAFKELLSDNIIRNYLQINEINKEIKQSPSYID